MDNVDSIRSNSSNSTLSQSNLNSNNSWTHSGKLVRKKASGLLRDAARSWGRSKSKEVLSLLISNNSPPTTKKKQTSNKRPEIGFGDWADTLNTAVASSTPNSPSSNIRTTDHGHHQHSNKRTNLQESLSSCRLPRPHPPRSPRRSYNTRATTQRSNLNLTTPYPTLKHKSTPPRSNLTDYQQPVPMTSSPFKRSVSPVNHPFDLDSPVASKSTGLAFLPQPLPTPIPAQQLVNPTPPSPSKPRPINASAALRIPSASSARANLFGAKPNTSAGGFFEPFSAPPPPHPPSSQSSSLEQSSHSETSISSLVGSSGCSWQPVVPSADPTSTRTAHTRQRTISSKEQSIRPSSTYGLGPLPEAQDPGLASELGVRYGLDHSSPSSRSCNGMVRIDGTGSPITGPLRRPSAGSIKGCSTLSRRDGSSSSNRNNKLAPPHYGSGSSRTSTRTLRDRDLSESSCQPFEVGNGGIDPTPQRRSFEESCDETDGASSSKPSSSHSILSVAKQQQQQHLDPFRCSLSGSSFLKSPARPRHDGFGALPPPESPFPFRPPPPGLPCSPNKLKRDNEGLLLAPLSTGRSGLHVTNTSCSLRPRADSLTPLKRDSWGRRSADASEEDEEENELVILPPYPSHSSLESHEGGLSVPGLTDSSSLASSLASSNQSSAQAVYLDTATAHRTQFDNNKEETESSGRDPKRRSLPPSTVSASARNASPHSFAHLPPPPGVATKRAGLAHKKSASFFSDPPLKASLPPTTTTAPTSQPSTAFSSLSSMPSSFEQLDPTSASNSFSGGSVRPEASAFLSSGMMPKKAALFERRRQAAGQPSPFAPYALPPHPGLSHDEAVALRIMRAALGGQKVIAAALRAHEKEAAVHLLEISSRSIHGNHNHSSSISSPFLSALFLHPANASGAANGSPSNGGGFGAGAASVGRRPSLCSLRMPDTPIKKPTFLNHRSSLHHLHQPHSSKPFVSSGLSKLSQGAAPLEDESPSKSFQHPVASGSRALGLDSPNQSPRLTGSPGLGLGLGVFRKSPLFRRRSSDAVLLSGGERSRTSRGGVAANASGGFEDFDPGTPTKVAPGWIGRGSQLLISPGSSTTSSPVLHCSTSFQCQQPDFLRDSQVTPSRPNGRHFSSSFQPLAAFSPILPSSPPVAAHHAQQTMSAKKRPGIMSRHSSVEVRREEELDQNNRLETEFDEAECTGIGEFGEVFKARKNGVLYAVKRAKKPVGGPKALSRQMEEVEMLRRLSSPYIIRLYDSWQHTYHLHIQTEFCPNGTLQNFLDLASTSLPRRLDEERIWKILSELSQALYYIHSAGILHLDLKPANVFVSLYGGLKVGDFGLALRWPRIDANDAFRDPSGALVSGKYPIYCYDAVEVPDAPRRFLRYVDIRDGEERGWLRLKNCGRFVGFDLEREGSREYIAPEILSGRYGEPADIFSIGLIGLEMVTNCLLPDNGDEWRGIRSNNFSRIDFSGVSSELVVVLKMLLESCPDRRLTVQELVRHPVLLKVAELRERGMALEEKGETQIDDEEEVKAEAAVRDGDTEMTSSSVPSPEQEQEEELFPEIVRPKKPLTRSDNEDSTAPTIWYSARGAVLPEAVGFLDFILTGEPTPQRVRRQLRRRKKGGAMPALSMSISQQQMSQNGSSSLLVSSRQVEEPTSDHQQMEIDL